MLRDAIRLLTDAGVGSPEYDARALARHAQETGADFATLVRSRADRIPLQHLIGSVGFRYIDLVVGPGVFVPRPETELVAGAAIDAARSTYPAPVVVDLCSGSGAIALSVANELPAAHVHAVEADAAALEWLRRNAQAREEAGDTPTQVHHAPVLEAVPELAGFVDVVVSNPPYVADHELAGADPEVREHDPHVALLGGGPEGLAVIADVAAAALTLLRPGGALVVEHSDTQGISAPALLVAAGFTDVADHRDLTGRPRYSTGRRP